MTKTLLFIQLLLATLSSTSDAAGLRALMSNSMDSKDDNMSSDSNEEQYQFDTEGRVFQQKTQSECLSDRYPYVTTVVDNMHALVQGREEPLVADSIDEANEVYKIVAAGIRETDKVLPPEERPRFMCVTSMDDMYCARNCEYPDLVDKPFCQAGNGTTWVANWADKVLQGHNDTRFRILKFDPYSEDRPLGSEIIYTDEVGRGYATERYFWATSGWLLDPPSSQEGCIGCVPSVPTETYTRGYTLAGGSPKRQGIAVAGVTLPPLPEVLNSNGTAVVSRTIDPEDPDYVHPMFERIANVCPCC